MLSRGAIVLVASGACALALGALLLSADTGRSPASAAPPGSAAAFRSGVRDRGGGAETASSDAAQVIAPKLFSPGACMAFSPTAGDRHETVFLDAGHGGIDPGAVGSTEAGASVKESTVSLAIDRAVSHRIVRAPGPGRAARTRTGGPGQTDQPGIGPEATSVRVDYFLAAA